MSRSKSTKKKISKETLAAVIGGIMEIAEAERQKDPQYQAMFKGSDGITGLLRDVEHRMSSIALDGMSVLEKKHGAKISKTIFRMFYGLPLVCDLLEKGIVKVEGHVCCVDKVFYLLAATIRKEMIEEGKNANVGAGSAIRKEGKAGKASD